MPPTGCDQHRVVFRDYSNSDHPIALPSPTYLRLHVAIAGILHMYEATGVMDQFEEKYGDGSSGSGLLAKSEYQFQNFIHSLELRSAIISARG